MMMKKVVLVFYFVSFVNGYSQTKEESIKELFNVIQKDSLMGKMFKSMIPVSC